MTAPSENLESEWLMLVTSLWIFCHDLRLNWRTVLLNSVIFLILPLHFSSCLLPSWANSFTLVFSHCLAALLILNSNVNDEEGHGSGGFAVHLGIFFVPLLTEFYYNCHQVAEFETTVRHEQATLDMCIAYVCGAYVRVCWFLIIA